MILFKFFITSWCSFVGGGVTPYIFCTAAVYPLFYAVVNALRCSRWDFWKRSWKWPMHWGRWFAVSTLGCPCWRWMSVPKEWSLWTPSSCWLLCALLHAKILCPIPIFWSDVLEVPQVHKDPSFLPRFPFGWFCLLLRTRYIAVVTYRALKPARNLSTGPPVGTGRLVAPLWRSDF